MIHSLVIAAATTLTPEGVVERLRGERGVMFLRSRPSGGGGHEPHARYSFVVARPFLRFRSFGSRCEIRSADGTHVQFGNPWHLLDALMSRCELLDQIDLPFPTIPGPDW